MKKLMLIAMLVALTGCASTKVDPETGEEKMTFSGFVWELLFVFDDEEPQTGTLTLDDGTTYEVRENLD